MAKRYRIQDRILLGMAILGDWFVETTQPVSIQLGKIKGTLPPNYGSPNLSAAVSKMFKTGYLEKIIKNGEPYLRITGKGKQALVRDFPIFSLRPKKWDRIWRIVFYDIPEKQRLRRKALELKLKELGFGMIQESVYISSFDMTEDLREFLTEQGLGDFVFVSIAKQIFAGSPRELVRKVWNLEKINDQYFRIYQEIQEKEELDKILTDYQKVLKEDPCLPFDLLPENWMGDRVHKRIKNLSYFKH